MPGNGFPQINKVVVSIDSIEVFLSDIKSLEGSSWLTDKLVGQFQYIRYI